MTFSAAYLGAVLDAQVPAGATGLAVALSGGADSAGLLMAIARLGGAFRGLPLRAVHVDHGLQPAARCFPLAVISVAVETESGASLEAAARDARYAAL